MAMPLAVHRFTVDEYHRMGEAGVLHEDDRVELLDGQIVQMTPIGGAHAACVNRLNALIIGLAGTGATVSIQNPLILGEHEEPQPDVAVLRYRADGYQTSHPRARDTSLVDEVADTSPRNGHAHPRRIPAIAPPVRGRHRGRRNPAVAGLLLTVNSATLSAAGAR